MIEIAGDHNFCIQVEDENGLAIDLSVYDNIKIFVYANQNKLVQKYALVGETGFKSVALDGTTEYLFSLFRQDLACLTNADLVAEVKLYLASVGFEDNQFVDAHKVDLGNSEIYNKITIRG